MVDYILPRQAPVPRSTLGWDGTDFRVLTVDASGHLQIDVLSSALPAGAATAAHQITMITALQLIDDLRAALQSVNTDALQVRGENQLFSLKDIYQEIQDKAAAGAGNNTETYATVPAGEIWCINHIYACDLTSAITRINIKVWDGVNSYNIIRYQGPAANEQAVWTGNLYMHEDDKIVITFVGCTAGDILQSTAFGYKMSVE